MLARKTQKLGATGKDESSSDSDDDDSMSKDGQRAKAIDEINEEISGSEESDSEDSDGEFKQDFAERKLATKNKEDGSIMNLKFM